MDNNFSRNIIKGRITESIFEQMFQEAGEFTVLPIGYEHTTPILAQYQHFVEVQKVLENIRNAPDFALISQDKKQVYLVEVKYRRIISNEQILTIAKETIERWDPCYLFIASNNGFYFSPCNAVLSKNGELEPLRESWINKELQEKYLALLREFISWFFKFSDHHGKYLEYPLLLSPVV